MKRVPILLAASAVGMVAVWWWSGRREPALGSLAPGHPAQRWHGAAVGDGPDRSRPTAISKPKGVAAKPSIEQFLARNVSLQDLEAWLESKQGDPHARAEALVTAGLILGDPQLIREGLEIDPRNPRVLLVAALCSAFSKEERLELSATFMALDPDNGLSRLIHAARLLDAGQSADALQILRGIGEHQRMNDHRLAFQVAAEQAYMAAGLPATEAKLRSLLDFSLGYASEVRLVQQSLKTMAGTAPAGEDESFRSLMAWLGQGFAEQAGPRLIIDDLLALSLAQDSLSGLPDGAPSPYDGLTVAQVRESLAAERRKISADLETFIDLQGLVRLDPEIINRYVDRVRTDGEWAANLWLVAEVERSK